jgi:hypothetical protein
MMVMPEEHNPYPRFSIDVGLAADKEGRSNEHAVFLIVSLLAASTSLVQAQQPIYRYRNGRKVSVSCHAQLSDKTHPIPGR